MKYFITLFLISFAFGTINVTAQPQENGEFMLERLRFMTQMGYWMNDPLYQFTVQEARTEDYCYQDLKQAYRRIDQLTEESSTILFMANKFQRQCENCAVLLDGQSSLLDSSIKQAETEYTSKVRWRRAVTIGLPMSLAAGFYLGVTSPF